MTVFFPKKAMILAAGLGTRMRPLTAALPKPLVPVAGKPLIDWSIGLLVEAGIEDIIVNSFYMAEMLEAHLARLKKPHIRISHEDALLETGGGIKKALPMLGDEPFFVLNSDTIALNGATPYLQRLARRWNADEMDALLLLARTCNASGYDGQGDFHLSATGTIRRRQSWETVPFVFSGVQLLHPRFFNNAPEGAFSMNVLYNQNIQPNKTLTRVSGIAHDGQWLHVGDAKGKVSADKILG